MIEVDDLKQEVSLSHQIEINYLNQDVAEINHLKIRGERPIRWLSAKSPYEAEIAINSLLNDVATVVEGNTTIEAVLKNASESHLRLQDIHRDELEKVRNETRKSIEEWFKNDREALTIIKGDIEKSIKTCNDSSYQQILLNLNLVLSNREKTMNLVLGNCEKTIAGLSAKIATLSEKIEARQAIEETREKTTLGGKDFEKEVFEKFKDISKFNGDGVDFVGDSEGLLKRKTGDILIVSQLYDGTLKPRVIVECKKDSSFSGNGKLEKVLREVKDAIANRGAHTCLYLFKEREMMPNGCPPVKIGENYVIASTDTLPLNILLELAKYVAGCKCTVENGEKQNIDIEGIKAGFQKIQAICQNLDNIMKDAKGAEQKIAGVHETAQKVKLDVAGVISRILEGLQPS